MSVKFNPQLNDTEFHKLRSGVRVEVAPHWRDEAGNPVGETYWGVYVGMARADLMALVKSDRDGRIRRETYAQLTVLS